MTWESLLQSDDTSNSEPDESEELSQVEYLAAAAQVNKYIKMIRLPITENPLTFWKINRLELPELSVLARRFLSAPPTSTSSEREFKTGKIIQSDRRSRLLPKNLETLLFLKYNLRATGYRTDLISPPENFVLPNSKKYISSDSEDSHGINIANVAGSSTSDASLNNTEIEIFSSESSSELGLDTSFDGL